MRKAIVVLTASAISFVAVAGCSSGGDESDASSGTEALVAPSPEECPNTSSSDVCYGKRKGEKCSTYVNGSRVDGTCSTPPNTTGRNCRCEESGKGLSVGAPTSIAD